MFNSLCIKNDANADVVQDDEITTNEVDIF